VRCGCAATIARVTGCRCVVRLVDRLAVAVA